MGPKDDQVRITSTDPKTVTIPRYDPAPLLTALDAIEEADEDGRRDGRSAVTPPRHRSRLLHREAGGAGSGTSPRDHGGKTAHGGGRARHSSSRSGTTCHRLRRTGEQLLERCRGLRRRPVVGGLLGWGLTEAFDDDDDHDHDHWWDEDDDWDNEDVEEALRERREFCEERRDDVLAVRSERLDTRRSRSAQRQADRNALRAEREGNRDSGRRRGRVCGRAEQRAERGRAREARGAESREERADRTREQLNERPEPAGGRTKPVAAKFPGPRREQARAERGTHDIRGPRRRNPGRLGAGGQAAGCRKRRAAGGRTAGAEQARITPGITRSYNWVRWTLQAHGRVTPAPRRGAHRRKRPRRTIKGMLLHQDG